MDQVTTSTFGVIGLTPFDAQNHPGLLLSGSEAASAEGRFGAILCQQYTGEGFTLLFVQLRLKKRSLVQLPVLKSTLASVSCIRGRSEGKAGGKLTMHSGQYFLAANSTGGLELLAEKEKECWYFIVAYNDQILAPLQTYFPVLASIMDKKSGHPLNQLFWMDKHIISLVDQFLHSHYEPTLRRFLFRERAEDMLYSMLIEADKQPFKFQKLSASDIEKVHYAKSLILENVKKHHSIEELSRKVELNEFKIKEGFRQLFGKGPYALLKDARMQVAYELMLHTNRPEKDIMTEAGYTSLTAFVKAFRNVFGMPPGKLRSLKRNELIPPNE